MPVGHAPADDSSDDEGAEIASSVPQESVAWRQEVAAKLIRYQARRKPRPPRYPSLRLKFEGEESDRVVNGSLAEANAYLPASGGGPRKASIRDRFAKSAAPQIEPQPAPSQQAALLEPAAPVPAVDAGDSPKRTAPAPMAAVATAKIIEFPRSWAAPPAPLEELAEAVIDRPRILEAPALAPPPPALGGITMEAQEKLAIEKRPGIDIPLQSAPLIRRILAAGLDAAVVAGASALFGFVFWKLAAVRPPAVQTLSLAVGLTGFFWAASQYLLIVYSGTTPGLLVARLELARFDGARASRSLRRWRVLASFLSAASLGMGYLWVFLDEDALCWHDRITHTYLAPRRRQAAK